MHTELSAFWNSIKEEFQSAHINRGHAFRQCVLATVVGEKVNQRTVVHRGFYHSNTSLYYTDARSKKVFHLKANPNSSVLYYHPELQLQVNVSGLITTHEGDELYKKEFEKLLSLKDYSNFPPPESSISGPNDYREGISHFMVLKMKWLEVDILQLSKDGHKRAVLKRKDDLWEGSWVVP